MFRTKANGGEPRCSWLDPARSFLLASSPALRPALRPAPSNSARSSRRLEHTLIIALHEPPGLKASLALEFFQLAPPRAFPAPPPPAPEGPAPCCASRVNHLQDQPRFSPASTLPLTPPAAPDGCGPCRPGEGANWGQSPRGKRGGVTAHRQQCHCFIIRPSDDRTDCTCYHTRPARA